MIERDITKAVEEALGEQAAVALVGPRQVGKTTVALDIAARHGGLYLDLEDVEDRARLAEPKSFLEQNADRLVILDEIHRVPELFQQLRGIIDRGRREGRGKGRFLMLGSASLDLLKQSGESLAGRLAYVDMTPLTIREVGVEASMRDRLWLRGGFPESFLAPSDAASMRWRRAFIRTYLEREIPLFGPRVAETAMERLWTMLAHRQGGILNASDLARSLEISPPAVTRYIDLLVDLLLVRRLRPFAVNIGKRLVKSPKIYVRDSGIVHALLGIPTLNALAGNPIVGASWEGFVIEQLVSALEWPDQASFYRTQTGAEIDLLIEFAGGERWAIEVKRSLAPTLSRGFHIARDDVKAARSFVVYAGDAQYPMQDGIEVIGLRDLANLIAGRSGSLA